MRITSFGSTIGATIFYIKRVNPSPFTAKFYNFCIVESCGFQFCLESAFAEILLWLYTLLGKFNMHHKLAIRLLHYTLILRGWRLATRATLSFSCIPSILLRVSRSKIMLLVVKGVSAFVISR